MDYIIKDTDLTAIANAIRSKNGSSDTYTVAEMADEIGNIETFGEKTYIIKDGKIMSGFNFSTYNNTTITEKQENSIPYVEGLIVGNDYAAVWTNTFDMSLFKFLKLELIKINDSYGRTWSDAGSTYAALSIGVGQPSNNQQAADSARCKLVPQSGQILKDSFILGIPGSVTTTPTQGYIKISFSGQSGANGWINIKNLILIK